MTAHSAGPPAAITSLPAFGDELKRSLHASPLRHLKVGALAQRLGLSQSTLYAYLAGTTLPPSDVLDLLLHELAVTPETARALSTARDDLDTRRRRPRPDAAAPRQATPQRAVPRELPVAPAPFTGREDEEALLDTARAEAADGGPGVVVLSGQPGVGKTALAVHWSHRVAPDFPDGTLYADLLGFSARDPRDPYDVLAALLRSLGAGDASIPADPDERVNRWRSAAAERRLLVLLDNALDAEQVRPLIAGGAGSLTLVTSRRSLSGLAVSPGARAIPVEPLGAGAAARVLRAQVADLPCVPDLAARCGGLPLLLRVVAARVASEPGALDGPDGLTADTGDPATSVRAVFGWSERRLGPLAGRAFRLLGSAPVSGLEPDDLAAYLGVAAAPAASALAELVDAHLVGVDARGATTMHDLLAEHSRERAAAEPVAEVGAARDRLLDHLVHRLTTNVELVHPFESGGCATEADVDAAQGWLARRWSDLVDLVGQTAESGEHERTIRLVAALRRHLDQSGHHLDGLRVLEAGRRAARARDLVSEELANGAALGAAYLRLGRHGEAVARYREVLRIARRAGDGNGEAGALNNLGNVQEQQGAYADALASYGQALVIARDLGLEQGEATLLVNIGIVHLRLGEPDLALTHTRAALALFERLGNRGGAARALGNLAEIQAARGEVRIALGHLDDGLARARSIGADGVEVDLLNTLGEVLLVQDSPAESREAHERALTGATAAGDRFEEARAHAGLGAAAALLGETAVATAHWTEAHTRYADLGLPQAERAALALATLASTSARSA